VFLAGATGVIGRRLVPLLHAAGHEVTGMTRSAEHAQVLIDLGATAVVCDVYDSAALRAAVVSARPELVMHQLTDLPDDRDAIPMYTARNARIRRVGTANLLDAARAAGARRFVAQSVAWELPGDGAAAIRAFEAMVLDASGVVIRYGQFYGPGTFHETAAPAHPRIHIDAAAVRTIDALSSDAQVVTIAETDDEHDQ
jgi:nucleoside-diphosphate-sugar epimerase